MIETRFIKLRFVLSESRVYQSKLSPDESAAGGDLIVRPWTLPLARPPPHSAVVASACVWSPALYLNSIFGCKLPFASDVAHECVAGHHAAPSRFVAGMRGRSRLDTYR